MTNLSILDDPVFVIQEVNIKHDALVAAALILVPGVVRYRCNVEAVLDYCDRRTGCWCNMACSCKGTDRLDQAKTRMLHTVAFGCDLEAEALVSMIH
jgi:hypothetical protein